MFYIYKFTSIYYISKKKCILTSLLKYLCKFFAPSVPPLQCIQGCCISQRPASDVLTGHSPAGKGSSLLYYHSSIRNPPLTQKVLYCVTEALSSFISCSFSICPSCSHQTPLFPKHMFFLPLLHVITSAKSSFFPLPPRKILFIWNNNYCKPIVL